MIELTRDECINLLDALEEWESEVGCKPVDPGESGLDVERYDELTEKLRSVL